MNQEGVRRCAGCLGDMVSVFNLETEKWDKLTPKECIKRNESDGLCYPVNEWDKKAAEYEPILKLYGYKPWPLVNGKHIPNGRLMYFFKDTHHLIQRQKNQ